MITTRFFTRCLFKTEPPSLLPLIYCDFDYTKRTEANQPQMGAQP